MVKRSKKEIGISATLLAIGIILTAIGQIGLLAIAFMSDDFIVKLLYIMQLSGLGLIGLWKSL